eukprot:CAMPEP_0183484896 /NCGR_PEP_ID=MMETSP0370-20130417/179154_1 /TAXON_ID=268820 /ORGANISM="Peridinium aciculiferum, Strain PAER-2" /LENGTH=411 /DNA_ID=CAMNT_0025678191 /DNA_START=102 /DNA_END=1337 /DNA_ORIENTATION=-
MGKNYYTILGIDKNASQEDIKKAYRKSALKWHPDKNRERQEEASEKFREIAEAYDVLSDPEKKRIYDQFGEEGLKGGPRPEEAPPFNGPSGPSHGGFSYQFNGDPNDIFARFFKDSFQRSSSFAESPFEDGGGLFGGGMFPMGGEHGRKRPAIFDLHCSLEDLYNGTTPNDIFARFFKDSFQRSSSFAESPFEDVGGLFGGGMFPMGGMAMGPMGMGMNMGGGSSASGEHGRKRPAMFDLHCSLEDLYNGTTRKLKVKRTSTSLLRADEAVLEIAVKPGWKPGTKVTFQGEGDEFGNSGQAQDVVFVIREKRHPLYTREGSNLLHHRKIPLVDALTGFKFDLPHLEPDKTLRIAVNEIVTPTYTKVVKGKGMPSSKDPAEKGDLVVTFDIVYPKELPADSKERLKQVLPRF